MGEETSGEHVETGGPTSRDFRFAPLLAHTSRSIEPVSWRYQKTPGVDHDGHKELTLPLRQVVIAQSGHSAERLTPA